MNAAIYCRVSTDDQEKEGTSLDTQLAACERYCCDKGYAIVKTFSETYSGLTLDRPKLTELRHLAATGNVQIVVIHAVDRLTRDQNHSVILRLDLQSHNVAIEAVTETIDNSDIGQLMTYARATFGKIEADKIKERTIRGKNARLAEGKLPSGTGKGAYGYSRNKGANKRVPIPDEAEIVCRMFEMVVQGLSLNEVATRLNKEGVLTKCGKPWCHITVRRTITNPIYVGDTYYGRRRRTSKTTVQFQPEDQWIALPDFTPAIVDRVTFDAAQEAIKKRSRPARITDSGYFLTGLIRCAECGTPIQGATLRGKYRYYRCRGTMPTRTRGVICHTKYIRADEVEGYVWDRFSKFAFSPITVLSDLLDLGYDSSRPVNIVPVIDKQLKAVHTRLGTYAGKERKLYSILTRPGVTQQYVLDEIDKLKKQEQEDKAEIDRLLDTRGRAAKKIDIRQKLSDLSDALKGARGARTPGEKKRWLLMLGARVTAVAGRYTFTTWPLQIKPDEWNKDGETLVEGWIEEVETLHTEITLGDMVDHSVVLPEDHHLLKTINELKRDRREDIKKTKRISAKNPSSVTIEQTWA